VNLSTVRPWVVCVSSDDSVVSDRPRSDSSATHGTRRYGTCPQSLFSPIQQEKQEQEIPKIGRKSNILNEMVIRIIRI
jgi:hypothetical protein